MGAIKSLLKKLPEKITETRYPILILVLGVILLMLPTRQKTQEPVATDLKSETRLGIDAKDLEDLLAQVKGAGQVRVLLSYQSGELTQYTTDNEMQSGQDESSTSLRKTQKTVLHSTGSGLQAPLVTSISAPSYRGAIIVCQGADNPSVKLMLVQAVAGLTGLGTNQIVVMKMK